LISPGKHIKVVNVKRSILLPLAAVGVLATVPSACGSGGNGPSASKAGGASVPEVDTTEERDDVRTCGDMENLTIGQIEPAMIEEVRTSFPKAPSPGPDESYVRVQVSGDWNGVGPAWAHNQLHFAVVTSSGDHVRQRAGRPLDAQPDDATTISSHQYYLVNGATNDLTLICWTADAEVPLRSGEVLPV
jgi:hypothetical protein